jgi:glycosyltransferase involved in cell wall biosynthesis
MRIGIALNLLAPDNGGVTNYVLTLLRHWPEYAPEHPMVLFSFAHNEPLLATLPPEARRHEIRLQTQEEALEHFDKIDVYFCPFGTLWPRPLRKPSVLTFHDMQERFYPEFFTAKEMEERFFHYDWSLRMADAVVAISSFTRDMAVQLTGASRRKFHVVPHVPDILPAPAKPAGWATAMDGRPFVFYPANFWKHKNHLRLLAAMTEVAARDPALALVCTGSLLGRESEWQEAVRSAGIGERVLHLGKITRAEISWLYQNARALVFPSLFEGFGIPLLEAMQSGCAIGCGQNTSQPDVAQHAALYFDAENPASIAAAILRLGSDAALRDRLILAGRSRLPEFSVRRLVDGHLAAFATARRRHNPVRLWYNERVRLPRSLQPRTALTPREIRVAARLLRVRAHRAAGTEFAEPLPPVAQTSAARSA